MQDAADFGELVLPPLAQRNVGAVFERALATAPDRIAVRDPVRSLSYGALYDEALAIGGGLAARGIAPGEFVLLMLDNHLDYIGCWLGLALTGRVEVPVNTAYKGTILAHVVNNSGARAIVIEAAYLPLLAELAERLTTLEMVIVRGPMPDSGASGSDGPVVMPVRIRVMPFADLAGPKAAPARLEPWDLMGILYTSGTTGLSKGVRVTQAHAYGYATPALFDIERPDEITVTASLPSADLGPIDIETIPGGPNHVIATDVNLPVAGLWTFDVTARFGEFDQVVFTVQIPVSD